MPSHTHDADTRELRQLGVPLSLWLVPAAFALLGALIAIPLFGITLGAGTAPFPEQLGVWQFFVLCIAAILMTAFLLRKIRLRAMWEALLTGTVFLGIWVYAWLLLPLPFALLAAALLTIVQARVRRVLVHNVFFLVGTAGIALNFAFLFHPYTLLAILVILLIYDIVGGRPKGFIVELVREFLHRGLVPGLIVPGRLAECISDIAAELRKTSTTFLGAGDLILPGTILAQAAVRGTVQALVVLTGILAGAAVVGRKGASPPSPALVPIGLGAGIPFAVMLIFHWL